MNASTGVTAAQLPEFLLNVATVRPVFIWGPPGIGKSSLLGSQLASEDLIGVPQILDGKSRFCPPQSIARDEPYCLTDAFCDRVRIRRSLPFVPRGPVYCLR